MPMGQPGNLVVSKTSTELTSNADYLFSCWGTSPHRLSNMSENVDHAVVSILARRVPSGGVLSFVILR